MTDNQPNVIPVVLQPPVIPDALQPPYTRAQAVAVFRAFFGEAIANIPDEDWTHRDLQDVVAFYGRVALTSDLAQSDAVKVSHAMVALGVTWDTMCPASDVCPCCGRTRTR